MSKIIINVVESDAHIFKVKKEEAKDDKKVDKNDRRCSHFLLEIISMGHTLN